MKLIDTEHNDSYEGREYEIYMRGLNHGIDIVEKFVREFPVKDFCYQVPLRCMYSEIDEKMDKLFKDGKIVLSCGEINEM